VDPLRPDLDGLYVVLVGSFNPAIVQPAWLAKHGLVSEAEGAEAEIEIIRSEIAAYRLGAFRFVLQQDRFQVETAQADQGFRLRDLVGRTFAILKETPIRQLGINRTMHFRMPSEEAWHQVGHRLAPKELWNGLVDKPGTTAVSVRGQRPGGNSKQFNVRIEPSTHVMPGVFVQTNDHFESDVGGAEWTMDVLSKSWDSSQTYALKLAQELLDRCLHS
jgi:hypothetical protein